MTEEEQIEQLPEPLKTQAKFIMMLKPEELPEQPEKNKWYVYRPQGCVCSVGTPYYSTLKVGTENKLMIMFCGGGVAIDAYSAARPNTMPPTEGKDTFYASDTFVVGYFTGRSGIAQIEREENPFRNWSIVSISYANGDFHSGTADFSYDDPEMGRGVCHHRGYINYRAMVEKIKQFVPNPEKILVTGYSAGGFGTAILTDDVMSLFPQCADVTCLVDSGAFSYTGWRETAEKQWGTPKEICERIRSDNITQDCLLDLYRTYGDKVKIAFGCTYRDALLAQCEGYTSGEGRLVFSKENGDKIQKTITKMVETLRKEIPNVALYIFDKPSPEKDVKEEFNLTEHTFIAAEYVYDYSFNGVRLLDWIVNAVNGNPQQVGLELLGL